MEIMLDTAKIETIQLLQQALNIAGVTTNPTILKKEGGDHPFEQLKTIAQLLPDASLHVQVVGTTATEMIEDAQVIANNLSKSVYIKVPTTLEGLGAMKILKQQDFKVTATAIYSEMQGYLALNVGADYLAPYYNRMENQGIQATKVIEHLANKISNEHFNSKLLAASFKNSLQVNEALQAGSHAVTVAPDILLTSLNSPLILQAVEQFQLDWYNKYKSENLKGLN